VSLAPSFDCFSLSTVDVETCSERERREAEGGRGAGREGGKEGGRERQRLPAIKGDGNHLCSSVAKTATTTASQQQELGLSNAALNTPRLRNPPYCVLRGLPFWPATLRGNADLPTLAKPAQITQCEGHTRV